MKNRRPHYRGPKRIRPKKPGRPKKGNYENCRLDPALRHVFGKIGVPESGPFTPDPFQTESLEKLKENDVLVSAPTGSGKTWIASRAIEQYLKKGLRVWYASPLKALSNSLYQEFSHEFGPGSCGILTGERKENPDAPIIVGTTEILRNQLYDSMHEGTDIGADLVILDEAHYLSDPDRGVVWEEVLIYLPSRVRLLLLSATISNGDEVCAWLKKNRNTSALVVLSHERPVPLETLFLFPDGLIAPLSGRKGLTPRVNRFITSRMVRGKIRGQGNPRFGDIISCLREFDLLPAIFFLKSRADCDKALEICPASKREGDVKSLLRKEVKTFLREYPHLKGHRQMGPLLDSLVASHHAGQLPYWKILIEKMMNKGYLDAIFSTSTVAAGVNFPARSVALIQSDRYNGHEFADLTATDLHQMIGRAGRRGMDNIGFALVIPGLHQDPRLIHKLMDSPPEPLISRIHINFSMTLNLLLSHKPEEVKALLEFSFANFQQKLSGSSIQRQLDSILNSLRKILPKANCDTSDPYEILDNIRARAEIKKEARRLARNARDNKLLDSFKPYLEKGRLFLHKDKGIHALFNSYMYHGRLICRAQGIEKKVRVRKGKIRFRKVPLNKIILLYDYILDIPDDYSMNELQEILDAIDMNDLKILDIEGAKEADGTSDAEGLEKGVKKMPCDGCGHLNDCHGKRNRELQWSLKSFRSLANSMEGTGEGLWISFKRHLRFLKETNFVDEKDSLTADGIWASKLRLDQPLLIAEAIRKGGFDSLSPEAMAGCIALFVWDRDQDVDLRVEDTEALKDIEEGVKRVAASMEEVMALKAKRGFENPPILFWPAVAVFLWAGNTSWEDLLRCVPIGEGDMASMIVRTADHLRQVANLKETHPGLAAIAKKAIDLILREPVLIP